MTLNNEEAVLNALLEKEPQHLRELARNTGLHPNTVSATATKLEKASLIQIEKGEKKRISYAKNEKAQSRKISTFIESLHAAGLITFLEEHYAYPTIILFGSAAKGELHANSDIDLCVISDEKDDAVLDKFQLQLKREIQLFIYTKDEFKHLEPELQNNIINGKIITGYLEVVV